MLRDFPVDTSLVPLNHASYGLPTADLLARAEQVRCELERDANTNLGEVLTHRLGEIAQQVHDWLGLPGGELALTRNTTEAAAAVCASLPLHPDDHVVVLDCEYSSVIAGWTVACQRAGASLTIAPLPLPVASAGSVRAALDGGVRGPVTYLQVSLITSSAALALPLNDLAEWVISRGGQLIVDAAHGPGHVDVGAAAAFAGVIFGTLHKWLPVPRGVGFLWAAPELADRIRPAEVSLPYAAATLAGRFSWPGTDDPTPRLMVPDAIQTWTRWEQSGLNSQAGRLANEATDRLGEMGAVPAAAPELRAPRLRGFVLPDLELDALRARLAHRRIRAWTGSDPAGNTLLRIATHIYTNADDLDLLVATLTDAEPRSIGSRY